MVALDRGRRSSRGRGGLGRTGSASAERASPLTDLGPRKELADHKQLTLATELDIYFCDPHSPWQRGSNENTNRLLRQYFPKGNDLSVHSQEHLDAVARELNERPGMTLNYVSPAEKFDACVASIG